MRRPRGLRSSCFLLLLLLAPPPLRAQATSLDEGSFRLLRDGRQVGTESFSIRQSGTGADAIVIAQGTVTLDTANITERLTASLRAEGPALRPAAYEVAVQGPDPQRIAGRVVGGRFSARILSGAGEQMREYLASEGAVLLDEGVAHHHYFLARRAAGGAARVPVIIPRLNRQVSAQVTDRGRETITLDGRSIAARHLVLAPTGAPERHVWVDDEARVLRVEVPVQRFEAVRSSPPR